MATRIRYRRRNNRSRTARVHTLTTEQQFLTAPRPTAAKYEKGPTFAQCAGGQADPKWGRVISRKQHCFRTPMQSRRNDRAASSYF
jgi:hypothetical protein